MSFIIRKTLTKNSVKQLGRITSTSIRESSNDHDKHVLHSDIPDVELPKASVDELVLSKADKWPDRIATECSVTGRNYTYDQLRTKTRNLGRALRKKLRLQKGEVLALLLPNTPEFVIAGLGALKAGLTVTTINPIYTPDEISTQLKDSSTKTIITIGDLYNLAKQSVTLIKRDIPILTIQSQQGQSTPEGAINFAEFVENIDFPDLPPSDPNDIAFMPYSSGTTGLPKGVELTHYNIVSNISQFDAKQIEMVKETTKDHQDVIPAVLPIFHIYGLVITAFHTLLNGCKIVTLPKFTPDLYVGTLKKYKPDVLYVAPPILLFLTNSPGVKAEDLQPIRTVASGSAPLGGLDEEKFIKKANRDIVILQGYGLTETSPAVLMTRKEFKQFTSVSGSTGRPIPNTSVKIVDPSNPSGPALGPNQSGELLIKGPQVMKGYHNRPEETEAVFVDSWFRTGDIAHYNDDHFMFITDRLKELIKVKGFQVAPAELEEVIRDYPDVQDVGVIGVPHDTLGEAPRAYVVPKVGKVINKEKLNEFINKKIASYKQLKGGIEIVESIPKNNTGKILRRILKQQYDKNSKG